MKSFTSAQEHVLLAIAIFGFLVPNGVFVYELATNPDLFRASFSNPIAIVLWLEAFVLLAVFCWLILRLGNPKPGWATFLVLSLAGSLACSVPAFLSLWSRSHRTLGNKESS